jgi:general stress protein 26
MGESAKKQHLHELLESFDTAMLITRHGEKNHARPMAIAGVDGASTVWFSTPIESEKVAEIGSDHSVSVTFQKDRKFVALSGKAEVVTDRAKVEELWKDSWKIWFPKGKMDPSIALIRVDVDDAEFWDIAGGKGIRFAFEVVKSLIAGERAGSVPDQHGRVRP